MPGMRDRAAARTILYMIPNETRHPSRHVETTEHQKRGLLVQYTYPCLLTPEDEGGFSVSFPDVPAALTCGDNRAEALEMAEDTLAVALGAYVDNREDLPLPSVPGPGQEMVAVPPVVRRETGPVLRHAKPERHDGGAGRTARLEHIDREEATRPRSPFSHRRSGCCPACRWAQLGHRRQSRLNERHFRGVHKDAQRGSHAAT